MNKGDDTQQPVSDEAISRANSTFQLVKGWRTDTRTVRMRMPLVLDGGVTAAWLVQSLHHWMSSWRECASDNSGVPRSRRSIAGRRSRTRSSFTNRRLAMIDEARLAVGTIPRN